MLLNIIHNYFSIKFVFMTIIVLLILSKKLYETNSYI